MTQKDIYELAGKLTDKEVAYLVASHLEQIGKAEMGFTISVDNGSYVGSCRFISDDFGKFIVNSKAKKIELA